MFALSCVASPFWPAWAHAWQTIERSNHQNYFWNISSSNRNNLAAKCIASQKHATPFTIQSADFLGSGMLYSAYACRACCSTLAWKPSQNSYRRNMKKHLQQTSTKMSKIVGSWPAVAKARRDQKSGDIWRHFSWNLRPLQPFRRLPCVTHGKPWHLNNATKCYEWVRVTGSKFVKQQDSEFLLFRRMDSGWSRIVSWFHTTFERHSNVEHICRGLLWHVLLLKDEYEKVKISSLRKPLQWSALRSECQAPLLDPLEQDTDPSWASRNGTSWTSNSKK